MKKLIYIIIGLITAILMSNDIAAYGTSVYGKYDFSLDIEINVNGDKGILELYYYVISDLEKTVELVDFNKKEGWCGYFEVPSEVVYDGTTYSVVGMKLYRLPERMYMFNTLDIASGIKYIANFGESIQFCDFILPPTLTTINKGAFSRSYYLIHDGGTGAGDKGRISIYSDTPLILSNYLNEINEDAFTCIHFDTVTIGRRIKEVGYYAFSKIDNLYCCAITPPKWNKSNLDDDIMDISQTNVMVPPGCKEAYQKDAFWGRAASIEEYGYNVDVEFSEGRFGYSDINSTFSLTPEITWLNENSKERYRDWTSSDETVATVDKDGVVTTHKYGKATITFTIEDERGIPFDCEYNLTVADLASVTDILEADDTDTAIEVFTLNGLKVSDTIDNLPAGLYIIKSAKEVKKVYIR